MIPLTHEENKSYEKQKKCYICRKEFYTNENNGDEFKLNKNVRDDCHYTGKFRGAAHNICILSFEVPKRISAAFHSGSTYDDRFIIKQLPEGQFECLGENTEKCITFSVLIKKEVANGREEDDEKEDEGKKEEDDNCKEDDNSKKGKSYKIKFTDSYRFIQSKLSDHVDNLSAVYNKDCKSCMERKKIKSECEFIELKNNRLNYKCKECQKNARSQKMKQLEIFRLCINFAMMILKFFLLLRKGVYPYEYMNNWVKFDDTSVTSKEAFHSELNEEGISDVNYAHVQKSWEVFKIEKMGEYHHLHVQ